MTGEIATEAVARELLESMFAAEGYNPVADRLLSREGVEFTADALDEASEIGFEYIDDAEVDTDMTPAEIAVVRGWAKPRILVVTATSPHEIRAAAAAFLASEN